MQYIGYNLAQHAYNKYRYIDANARQENYWHGRVYFYLDL
jgi:hypothetical protein